MALTKMVDGVRVQVSAAEEQAITEEWNTVDPITPDQVNTERDRRIAQGISVTTSVAGTFPVQARSRDLFNITALATLAQQWISESDTTPIIFRDANNTDQTLTPSEMIELGKQVMQHVDDHYKAAWTLKDTSPIPQNYTDNTHWPA